MDPINNKEPIKTKGQQFWELVRFALIALIIVMPIRFFIAEPFIVSGSSMVPTFENGDYLIVDKLSYELSSPQRNDVVVFRYPGDTTKFFIKRIVGLPNETVDVVGNEVIIFNQKYPEGLKLNQSFVKNPSDSIAHLELKNDEYFVMGDNRGASSDSRYWGAVKKDLLQGRAFVRLLPVNKVDIWPGYYKQ